MILRNFKIISKVLILRNGLSLRLSLRLLMGLRIAPNYPKILRVLIVIVIIIVIVTFGFLLVFYTLGIIEVIFYKLYRLNESIFHKFVQVLGHQSYKHNKFFFH